MFAIPDGSLERGSRMVFQSICCRSCRKRALSYYFIFLDSTIFSFACSFVNRQALTFLTHHICRRPAALFNPTLRVAMLRWRAWPHAVISRRNRICILDAVNRYQFSPKDARRTSLRSRNP